MSQEIHPLGEPSPTVVTPPTVVSPPSANGFGAAPASRPGGLTPVASAPPSALGLLRALKRRLTIALGAGLLAALVCGTAAWFLVPQAKYKAQAVLHVAAQPPQVLFRTVETQNPGGGEEYIRYQKTQVAWVKSRMVLNAALGQPGVKQFRMIREQDDPLQWLHDKLDVHFEAGSELLNICLSGDQPEEVAALVNAVKHAYMEEVVNVEHKKRLSRYEMLRELKEQYAHTMKDKREALKKLAEGVGSDDRNTLAFKQQLAMEHLEYVNKELLDIRSRKRKVQVALKMQGQVEDAPEPAAPPVSEAAVAQAIEQDPVVAGLRQQLAEMEGRLNAEIARARRVARSPASEPALRYWRDQVELLKRSLVNQYKTLRPIVLRQLRNQETGQKESQGEELQQQLAVLEDLEQGLEAEFRRLKAENHHQTLNTLDLQSIQDELGQVQDAADKIGKEVEALNVELQAPPRVKPLEDAVVPISRDDQKRYLMIGLITFGSFLGGLLGVAFLELQSQKVDTADEVVVGLGLSIVGALPLVPTKVRRGGLAAREGAKDRYWYNLLLESIDATRTMVVHAARSCGHRVVMVSSAESGEGKTTLASHLATSLARTGLKTVLIDADLRCPTMDRLFDVPPEPGLSELLRGEFELEAVLAPTAVEELRVITAGRYDQATIRILAQGGLGPIFEQLKGRFDFVILDSSPLLPVADGLLIAQQADAVLFSILRDVSRKAKVFAAYQRLSRLGVSTLGAVVTGTYGGVYGYGYYSGQPYAYPAPGRNRNRATHSPESRS